jgi:putative Mn2+ efflux pump MntP
MKIIGYISTTIILMVYAAMLNGWALAKLWSWFIVQTFNLPVLSIPAAIGLSMVVGYLTHQMSDKKNEDEYWETLVKGGVAATVKPIFALLFGAIVKLWL